MALETLPVVVIGAGPVGLTAAVRLLERGLKPLILEAAADVAASPRDWGHVRLFSPWRYNLDKVAVQLLERTGWTAPPANDLPTGNELYGSYLRPLAALENIRERLHLDRRVVAITRQGLDKVRTSRRADVPFVVRAVSATGLIEEFLARAVIDATGTWWSPNPLGAAGIPAAGEAELKDRIHYGIPDVLKRDRSRYASKATLVVGAGHSAANSILGLAELARTTATTSIIWATRSANLTRVFGGGDGDGLPARGKLGAELRALTENGSLTMVQNFRIETLREGTGKLDVAGTRDGRAFVLSGIDSIVASTGQRPDLAITRELRLALDPALESAQALGPLIDPNEHSCGTVRPHGARELAHPEPNFYIIGGKSYGRAPTFLLATGYEQARSVAAMIAGDHEAAARVELELPETGVCNSDQQGDAGGCCVPGKKSCC
ncbi:MAG: flavoprotein [Polyangiaceae bacterium]|nr:flavoprotein [Polyangiaceae bacterium]